jgi:hypothetical protein
MDAILAVCNAFLNLEAKLGSKTNLIISDQNAILTVARGQGGGASGSVSVTRYRIKSIDQFHLVCRTWDGAAEGDTDVLIAKQANAMPFTVAEDYGGILFLPTYAGHNNRTMTNNTGLTTEKSFTETLMPPYVVSGVIYAAYADGGTGVAGVNAVELSPARRWQIDFKELDVCLTDGTPVKILVQSTTTYPGS